MLNILLTVLVRPVPYASSMRRASILATLLIGLVVTCAIRSGVALAQYTPSVRTDRTAYAAGDEVAIRGQGFEPHEAVTYTVTREDGNVDPLLGAAWSSSADDSGN